MPDTRASADSPEADGADGAAAGSASSWTPDRRAHLDALVLDYLERSGRLSPALLHDVRGKLTAGLSDDGRRDSLLTRFFESHGSLFCEYILPSLPPLAAHAGETEHRNTEMSRPITIAIHKPRTENDVLPPLRTAQSARWTYGPLRLWCA